MSSRRGRRSSSPAPLGAPARIWPRLALIVAAGVLAYSTSLAGPFIFDDQSAVVENAQIRDLRNISAALTPPVNTPLAGRPLVNLSLAINYAMGGLDVTSYHVVNIALHLVCALLIFGIVRRTAERLGGQQPPPAGALGLALAVALIWTVHPLVSEVVNYTTQRTESMMAVVPAAHYVREHSRARGRGGEVDGDRRARLSGGHRLQRDDRRRARARRAVRPRVRLPIDRRRCPERGRLYAGLASSWVVLGGARRCTRADALRGISPRPTSHRGPTCSIRRC